MFKIMRKEIRSFLKDRRAMLLTFFVPIFLITIFSLAFGGVGKDSDVQTIPLLVADEDHSKLSKEIVAALDSVKLLEIKHTVNDTALMLIQTGKRSAALFIHKGFGDSVNALKSLPWELEYDAAQAQQMGILQQYLGQSIYGKVANLMSEKLVMRNMNAQFGGMDSGMKAVVFSQVNKNMATSNKDMQNLQQNTMRLKMTSVIKSAQDNIGMVQAVAGTAVMMLLFSLTAMGGRILEEKENGTLKRLLYSPLHSNQILMGKMATSILVAFCQLMVMLIYSSLLFGLHLWSKLPQTIILVIATAFACTGFGVFLASIAKTREQLQGLSTLFILSMSAVGGSMIPTFIMPHWMQNISPFSVNYWSIQGFFDIFWRQLPIAGVYFEKVGVLLLIGLVLTFISFRLFRKNILSMV
jgi:ABC-type multidrug transport system permease subunit